MSNLPPSILITGCSSGIGWHVSRELKSRGWDVYATARRQEDLTRLRRAGLHAIYLDYSEEASIAAAVERVSVATKGQLDALFNNGAHGLPGAVEDITTTALRWIFEANLFGWHTLTRLVLPTMRSRGTGRIIQCSSVLGFAALRFRGAYSSSKFALEGLCEALRIELQDTGIHVISIQPGPIFSNFRTNAHAAFLEHVDWRRSLHRESYRRQFAMEEDGETNPKGTRKISRFTLGPDAVFRAVYHALTANRPQPVYRVTAATHLLSTLTRLTSATLRLKLLTRLSDSEIPTDKVRP